MERVDGSAVGGMMWPQGVQSSSAAAMLGLGTGTQQQQQQQPVAHHPQYSLLQQLQAGGFQHPQPQPMPVPAPEPEPEGEHEEEPMPGAGAGNDDGVPGPGFAWSRVKWTDAMVRLLIMVVYNAGPAEDASAAAEAGKEKASSSSSSSSSQVQQQGKKGKWRSASQAMMDRGFAVSPQQCEDKFNDLNKRYKRVVDLLGKDMARAVLQNPAALLDAAIDKLSPAAKELARRLLGPKQLFGFREMCLYHNASQLAPKPVNPVAPKKPAKPAVAAAAALPTITEVEEDEEDEQRNPKRKRGDQRRSSKAKEVAEEEEEETEEDDPEEDSDALFPAMAVQRLQSELGAMGPGGDDPQLQEARRQWLRRRAKEVVMKLKACDRRDKEIREHRLKWERFREAKEREMDLEELRNIRARRQLLLLKHKELDRKIAERQRKQKQKEKQKQVGPGPFGDASSGGRPSEPGGAAPNPCKP